MTTDLKVIEAKIRALHYYGNPPDRRLQADVDGDVADIMEDIAALEAENASMKRFIEIGDRAVTYLAVKVAEAERNALAATCARLTEFFWRCWDGARGAEVEPDGSDIQDWATELGLLKKVTATAPCGERCFCQEWDDFPQDCYRPTVERAASAGREPGISTT